MQRALPALAVAALALSAAVPFWNWHPDEMTYVQVALESRAAHQWLDATYLGAPSFLKPPLLTSAMRAAFWVLGDNVFAARGLGLLCLALCAWGVSRWARREAGPHAGVVAALTVLLSPAALRFGHLAMMDVPLAGCFLLAAVVGREVRSGASGAAPVLGLLTATAVTELLKGPALLPLVVVAFVLEAGRFAARPRWVLALLGGVVLGSSWLLLSYARHGEQFVAAFFGRENLGKFSQAWSPLHVLALVVGVGLCALPYRLWPLGFFRQPLPAFARWFPVAALAFYAVPSVTFAQYMVCVLPAVALGVGVLGLRTPRWVVLAHVGVACLVLLGGALTTRLLTSRQPFACRSLEVEGDKPAQYWLWLVTRTGAACHLKVAACEAGVSLHVPKAAPRVADVLEALTTQRVEPLTTAVCLTRGP
jgi:4-amino-4-deoxy-L-arabinose transferase-like glycosyltransferase